MKSIKKVILGGLVLSVMASSMVTAKTITIELKDPVKAFDIYAALGVATKCSYSSELTFEQKYEMKEIIKYLDNVRRKKDMDYDSILQDSAAEEKFNFDTGVFYQPTYKECSKILKK